MNRPLLQRIRNKALLSILFFLVLIAVILGINFEISHYASLQSPRRFDGQEAFQKIEYQISLGPRIPGSQAHAKMVDWIQQELSASGWTVQTQTGTILNHSITNVIGRRGTSKPWVILGAHFDTRMVADHDLNPSNRTTAVPGANDGASGVAVLLELARVLPAKLQSQVWLVFFDAEDQGNIPGWDWILGSRYFVNNLHTNPDSVIIVDMVGDADLNLFWEHNSDNKLKTAIWNTAIDLGYGATFIKQNKYRMLDDHTPFLEKGIPAVDIIDFDYPPWHTIGDTQDKISPASLEKVGETLRTWIMNL